MSGDPLSDVLQAVRLSGAAFFRVEASSPWVATTPRSDQLSGLVLPHAQHVFQYHVVTQGSCWARTGDRPPVRLGAGDIVVFPHGDEHALSSDPDLRSRADLTPFRKTAEERFPFRLHPGDPSAPVDTRVVCGFLGCDARPFNPVLGALPRLLHVSTRGEDDALSQFARLAAAESDAKRAGGESILARLSELMFVEVVRRSLDALPHGRGGWLAGLRDPHVGRVLVLLHGDVSRAWSLEELAAAVGLSRSGLAERFAEVVGQPPMQYLTLWRMQVAAGLLATGTEKVAAVASRVGYGSEAAFSRAFKRATGVPPSRWAATR